MSPRGKVPVTFTFHQCGVQPPLFVAGSFSEPPWEFIEMDAVLDELGEYTFSKQIMADESSEFHYKFRHGSGDWWPLDPNAETVTDEHGNVNSLLRTPAENVAQSISHTQCNHIANSQEEETSSAIAPSNGTDISVATVATAKSPATTGAIAANDESFEEIAEKTELGSPAAIEEVTSATTQVAESPFQTDSEDLGLGSDGNNLPMFSHECFAPTSDKLAIGDETMQSPQDIDDHSSTDDGLSIRDYDDPRLEHFPSDRDSIMATMRRLSSTVDADDKVVKTSQLSPIIAPDHSDPNGLSRQGVSFDEGEMNISHKQPIDTSHQPTDIVTSRYSLDSIMEGDESLNDDDTRDRTKNAKAPAEFVGPAHKYNLSMASLGSDEDEGIAMSIASRKSTHEAVHMKTADDEPHNESDIDEIKTNHVIVTEEDAGNESDSLKASEPTEQLDSQKSSDCEPPSVHPVERREKGGWLGVILRTLYVSWISDFIIRQCGRAGQQM
ncbi:hypothetical protein GGS21DRAFT_489121 [Xylaria nigripes]|nr:hypothetical protein GGS21DRAFT_489121 [Xylaria nigripes]